MKRLSLIVLSFCLLPLAWAENVDGLIVKSSPYSVATTIDRLEGALKKKGITIVTRWNHAAKAKSVDIPLPDTDLLLFGIP